MARLAKPATAELERLEGELAQLGNALVYLQLIADRLVVAIHHTRAERLLAPALSDLERARRLITSVQGSIHHRTPSTGAGPRRT